MDASFPDHTQIANLSLIEDLYKKYLENPESVEASWRYFFQGIDFAGYLSRPPEEVGSEVSRGLRIVLLIQAYQRFGHLAAQFNPLKEGSGWPDELSLERLGFSEADLEKSFPTLGYCTVAEAPLRQIVEALKGIYAARIGYEFMDLGRSELEHWLSEKLKAPKIFSEEEKRQVWEQLAAAEGFEQFLHRKYVGQTRFSLEGGEAMIPLLLELVKRSSELGVEEILVGMAHRGRLNVLAHVIGQPLAEIFREFEDDTVLSQVGHDDVKYHMGFSKEVALASGKKITLSMAANPSHLESIDPIVLGQVRALQVLKEDQERRKISAVLIHGDASFAGQGVVYETLQLMNLPAYSVGGTIHLIVNNQIGYTTGVEEGRSTRYCTDLAKTFGLPVFHVNGEDPESCLWAAYLAAEIRQKFQCDVFIDLICYRKYGHNEGDEPSYTQPIEYKLIRSKQSVRDLYLAKLIQEGVFSQEKADAAELASKEKFAGALEAIKHLSPPKIATSSQEEKFSSGVGSEILKQIAKIYCQSDQNFHLHPKLEKWMHDRLAAVTGDEEKSAIDWSTAEMLALGSLLYEGISVRLAGEDSERGTFSQRHLILIDAETGEPYSPLARLKEGQGRLDVVNTPLTEFAGMGFEYGYSWSHHKALVLWEAQYGDFNNSAQVIIDQYLASGEHKWNTPSSLTLLLPHAYEGAGPEHSSARLERFLQLAAEENLRIVNPSTAAQYFHLLRRQVLQKRKKPLIVMTPKSLLRSSMNMSPLKALTQGHFEEVLDDAASFQESQKILFCSGKIYYDLLAEREKRQIQNIALVRIEEFYPFPEKKLKELMGKYHKASQWVWVQEEPENAGAWSFIHSRLDKLSYIGRPANATTATGSHRKHKQEQQELLNRALELT